MPSKEELKKMLSTASEAAPVISRGKGYHISTQTDSPAAEQDTAVAPAPEPAKKLGRPRKPPRTKKTIYLFYPENIDKIKKALFKNGDLWLDEESIITDLALAVLAELSSDASKVKSILDVFEAEIKPASEK